MDARQIYDQSLVAPGLPNMPRIQRKFSSGLKPEMVAITSINYDYLPDSLESPKQFWLELRDPAPRDLQVGTVVRLHLTPGVGIQTTFDSHSTDNSLFKVEDVSGRRVILYPFKGSTWLPTVHAPDDNPFGWGYDTNWVNVRPMRQYWGYGYGTSVSFLEYYPQTYSTRAANLQLSWADRIFLWD